MATELSMNGRKKIETVQKEFSNKFPYLTLIFLNEEKELLDVSKTLSEVRKSKGDDISIIASLKVNNLEKKFFKNYGLIVEVAYQQDGKVLITEQSEERTLNELNNWCESNCCGKFDYKKNNQSIVLSPNSKIEVHKEILYDEDKISYTDKKLNNIKDFIKILRQNIALQKNVFIEIYTEDYLSQETIENCVLNGKNIRLKRTNWWEDSTWESTHSIQDSIDILIALYTYGRSEVLDYEQIIWNFVNSGKNDNGCDIEFIDSELNEDDEIPSEILTDEGEIDVWELRDYTGYTEDKVDVDFDDISYQYILFKFNDFELKIDPNEIDDLVSFANTIEQNDSENENILFSDDFIDQAIVEHNAHEDGFDIDFEEVKIGDQSWMLKNLNVDKFRNGDPIPYAETDEEWVEAGENGEPAWCYFDNDSENGAKYGKLYNWYAVNDSRGLAPEGWHIPSENEFIVLFSFIEDDDEVNDFKLKCDVSWGPDSDGTNQTGFTAMPSGYRNELEGFIGMYDENNPEESYAAWWSSTESDSNYAYYRAIEYEYDGEPLMWESNKGAGLTVRCIKGVSTEKIKSIEDT